MIALSRLNGNTLTTAVAAAVFLVCNLVVSPSSTVALAGGAVGTEVSQATRDSIAVLLSDRQFDKAIDLARSLVEAAEANGAQGADLARELEIYARALRRGGQSRQPKTLGIAIRAVAACAGPPAADANLEAACRNSLGLIYLLRSENELALPLFEAAAVLWSTGGPENDQKEAAALNNQGKVLESLGRDELARVALEAAAAVYEKRRDEAEYLGKWAETTMSLANLHLKLGEYDQARDRGEQAVETFRYGPGLDRSHLGSAVGDLAALHRSLGNLERAEALYEEAIPLLETALGREHAEVGRILNNLGNLRADRGDIAAARDCFERALVITEQSQGPDAPQTGVRLLNLGSIMSDLGDLKKAAECLRRSEKIILTSLGPDHMYMGYAKQGVAVVMAAQGDPEGALLRFQEALTILEAKLGPDHLAVAEVLGQEADVLMELGRHQEAGPLLARGLVIVTAELGLGHPEIARLLRAQGRLALATGNAWQARSRLARALAVGTQALGSDHPMLAEIHLDLARALAALDSVPSAFEHAIKAERIGRDHFALAAVAFEERRALQFAGRRTRGLDLAMDLALRLRTAKSTERVWDELILSRSLVLDLMGSRQKHQHLTPAPQALSDSLQTTIRELANLFVRGVAEDTPDAYRATLTRQRDRRDDLEQRLAATSLDFARQAALRRAGFSRVAAALPSGSCLVSYLYHATGDGHEVQLAALVRRSGGTQPELIPLGRAVDVERAVDVWRQSLVAGLTADGDHLAAVAEDCRVAGRALAAMIWDPLDLDRATGRLFVVPDGALTMVDFQALPRRQGGFLIENEGVLNLVSAERDLLAGGKPASGPKGLLVMGGMEFGEGPGTTGQRTGDGGSRNQQIARGYQDLRFQALPGTLFEARTVADLWRSLAGEIPRLRVGADARERAFKDRAPEAAVIHLATHGFVLPNNGLDVNPLLLTGLAFTGANVRSAAGDGEDGILTACEVAGLNLAGLQAAVLSGCDTGKGELRDREGVFGLQRAFAMAGARSLIISLTPVDDDIAATWMGYLYRGHLSGDLDLALAARHASVQMLQNQRSHGWPEHPFTWSPFVSVRTGT